MQPFGSMRPGGLAEEVPLPLFRKTLCPLCPSILVTGNLSHRRLQPLPCTDSKNRKARDPRTPCSGAPNLCCACSVHSHAHEPRAGGAAAGHGVLCGGGCCRRSGAVPLVARPGGAAPRGLLVCGAALHSGGHRYALHQDARRVNWQVRRLGAASHPAPAGGGELELGVACHPTIPPCILFIE